MTDGYGDDDLDDLPENGLMQRKRKRYTEPITPGVPPPGEGEAKGLTCRRCGCRHFRVVSTRGARAGRIMRRRECRHCGTRLSTIEKEQR